MKDYSTIHLDTNKSTGTTFFIAALHFSYSTIFNNEHKSYPKMTVKRNLALFYLEFTFVSLQSVYFI